LNTEYLRELNIESFAFLARPILAGAGVLEEDADEDYVQAVLGLCQGKARSLEELPEFCAYFFKDTYALDEKVGQKLAKKSDPKALLTEVLPVLESSEPFSADTLKAGLEEYAEAQGNQVFAYFPVIRYALSGQGGGPDLLPMLEVMGRTRVLERIQRFTEA
jgi:glutamyl/glutaminyl-tRNA synthetase